ncbi:MAG: class I SAM-dependent methyltransferase [Thermomicrobiales bacterium]|jgi:SAM-dependent methyltransferase|nr:class I SAM-dependent methyltransferase [Thermomicrobiales bacterium]
MERQERNRRKQTFDAIAALYDRARPGYPDELFDDVVALSGIPAGGRILEIGPGTGHATLPFAQRGYRIDAVELGSELAAVWQRNLAAYPNASITVGSFEAVDLPDRSYDLAIAASSFHWIDPDVGLSRVAAALKKDGVVALWWNRRPMSNIDRAFLDACAPIYQRNAPHLATETNGAESGDGARRPSSVLLEESGLFGAVTERQYAWEHRFDADEYTHYLSSFSPYQVLEPDVRSRLLDAIHDLIETQFDGSVTRAIVTYLYMARTC